jgi:amino-acid N-acetyltransferase
MNIHDQPNKSQVIELLTRCDLPTLDLHDKDMKTFLGWSDKNNLKGVVGIEVHGRFGLLRSLAVAPEVRSLGCGKDLVLHIEDVAGAKSLKCLYLLTTTAQRCFMQLGYQVVQRDLVPTEIQQTSEFSSVCPDTATVMYKQIEI